MTHPWFAPAGPRILAHRGLVPEDAPDIVENSFAAVAAAHAAGAHYVESDCHLTADGAVVLFHDADLRRLTGDPRAIANVTLAELDELMSTRGGLCTVSQAFDAFPTVRFNLDVKAEAAAAPLGRILAPHTARVLVTSFSDARRRATLAAIARHADARPATSAGRTTILRALAAAASGSAAVLRRALAGIDALQVPERQGAVRIVTPRLIAAAHRIGVEVHVWTVNDPAEMTRLLDLGVDGLVTDRADVALRLAAGRV